MKDHKTNSFNDFKEDSIDIIPILKKIWKERKLILKATIIFFFVGCLVALLSPIEFTSQTSFVPQVSDDEVSSGNNRLGSLASLAGIKLNPSVETSDSYLSPLVYTNIIESEEFSLKLLDEELKNLDNERFSIREYLQSKKNLFDFNPIDFIKKYTIGLVFNKTNVINKHLFKNYNFISDEDYVLINYFRKKFTIELSEKEGYIKVLTTDKNAFISAQLAEKITKSLQSKIIEIRTNKIKERLRFSKEQYEIKQLEFDILQNKLAEFKDSNKNISTARFRSQLQKLESEYQLQQNILINLASEYNNNKIKLNKDTPIFSVIDEVSVPNKISAPNRMLLVIIHVLFGIIISTGYVLTKDTVKDLILKIKD